VASEPVVAAVRLWGRLVGAVAEDADGQVIFEYDPRFARSGWEISPRHLLLSRQGPVTFPQLRTLDAFQGLPGVLADALPDRFGNAVIKTYFEQRGRPDAALSPVQRLLYIGPRAIGALEFEPPLDVPLGRAAEEALEVRMLVEEARRVIEGRSDVAVPEIMQLGASAGGARAKAVVLWNPKTDEVRSAFAPPKPGDEPWIIKFDGVGEPGHPDPKPQPFNRTEYAYHLMAREAGIETAEARLLEERRLAHFMSRRFDREISGGRIHFHSLGGLDHADYNAPRSYSYEQYLLVCRELRLAPAALEEAFRRVAFNIVSVNQDDHVKNFAFLMNQEGAWRLSPAYDITFAQGRGYTRTHQMTLNGKAEGFVRADLLKLGAELGLKQGGGSVIDEVCAAVKRWPAFAKKAKVPKERIEAIAAEHRLKPMRA
jgi:serine/threonine-protein kinase HipA